MLQTVYCILTVWGSVEYQLYVYENVDDAVRHYKKVAKNIIICNRLAPEMFMDKENFLSPKVKAWATEYFPIDDLAKMTMDELDQILYCIEDEDEEIHFFTRMVR